MEMTMKEAMQERHMVRKYLDKPIPADIVETLNDRIRKLNNDHGIEMKLITEDKSAFSTVVRLILAKGVTERARLFMKRGCLFSAAPVKLMLKGIRSHGIPSTAFPRRFL